MAFFIMGTADASDYSKLSGGALADFVRQDCGACHGLTLKGGLGQPLTADKLGHLDVETIRGIVLDGVPGTAMPPWAGILTAEQADWIARQLKEGSLQ
jgi:cytochrome c55X